MNAISFLTLYNSLFESCLKNKVASSSEWQ